MKFIKILFYSLLIMSCTTKQKTPVVSTSKPVNEVFYPYYTGNDNSIETIVYKLDLTSNPNEIKALLSNAIQGLIIEKSFLSSQIFPEGSLYRKRVHSFSLDMSTSPKHIITAKLTKDSKYSSYKLVIQKINPKKREEAYRQWLFSDTLSDDQIAIRISRTIVKYSFQSL